MRLSKHEIRAIKETVAELDPTAQVYLFGSRVDDNKRGGDIDLLIMSTTITDHARRAIKQKLYDKIGEQKIDLLIAADNSKPFVKIALEQGIRL